MNFSKLRHRITLIKPTYQQNGTGENEATFADYKTVWANVVPVSGKELIESQKLRAETAYKISLRYASDVTSDMRIRYNQMQLEISAVINVAGRNRELQLVAYEV
jgi:SPP1 family predicted phage head-tail adaptor